MRKPSPLQRWARAGVSPASRFFREADTRPGHWATAVRPEQALTRGSAAFGCENLLHYGVELVPRDDGLVARIAVIVGLPVRGRETGPDTCEVFHKAVAADLALLERVKPRIDQKDIRQPVLHRRGKAVILAQARLSHQTAQRGWNELVSTDGMRLARRAVDPAVDFADGHLRRTLWRQPFGPVLHGVIALWTRLGPSDEAFEVRGSADPAELLERPAAAAHGFGPDLRFGLDLMAQLDLTLPCGLHDVERDVALHGRARTGQAEPFGADSGSGQKCRGCDNW